MNNLALSFPLAALALLFCLLGAQAKQSTCINMLVDTKVDVTKGLKYETGRKKGLWVSHSDAYQCDNFEEFQEQPSFPFQYGAQDFIIGALMAKNGYFAQITKKGCTGSDGIDYCCEAGLKSFDIVDAYVCDKIIAGSNIGMSKGNLKMTFAIEYSCNQEARRKSVALRFNAAYNTACVTPSDFE